jgi:NAD(P)-dependent dehydrogenase (short-subunit alcohol dehydrogenase family)
MVERRSGRIVNVSSDAARVGSSGEAVYAACKGGLVAFSKTLAREHARHGITVNVVCPGPTQTALVEVKIASNQPSGLPTYKPGRKTNPKVPSAIKSRNEPTNICGGVRPCHALTERPWGTSHLS